MEWTKPNLEWRMRAILTSGSAMVGGYVGCQNQHLYIADELSGEIHEIPVESVDKFDVKKYSEFPTR